MWSEGAIYNIGFERGICEWRKFIKHGGYIAVSEVSWFSDIRPKEIEDFWIDAYSEIDTIPKEDGTAAVCRLYSNCLLCSSRGLLDRPFLCSTSRCSESIFGETRK